MDLPSLVIGASTIPPLSLSAEINWLTRDCACRTMAAVIIAGWLVGLRVPTILLSRALRAPHPVPVPESHLICVEPTQFSALFALSSLSLINYLSPIYLRSCANTAGRCTFISHCIKPTDLLPRPYSFRSAPPQ